MLVKSEGGVLYGTTDLATMIERRARAGSLTWSCMWSITASTAISNRCSARRKKRGLSGKAHLEHVGFGTMNGPDGKPFKTRAGGVMKLHDLIAMAATKRPSGWTSRASAPITRPDERAEIARQVGIATIKFADLSHQRTTDYIFDLEKLLDLRRQDRALSAICRGAHPLDPAQGQTGGFERGRPRRLDIPRKSAP